MQKRKKNKKKGKTSSSRSSDSSKEDEEAKRDGKLPNKGGQFLFKKCKQNNLDAKTNENK